jgi:hypothetical protein
MTWKHDVSRLISRGVLAFAVLLVASALAVATTGRPSTPTASGPRTHNYGGGQHTAPDQPKT